MFFVLFPFTVVRISPDEAFLKDGRIIHYLTKDATFWRWNLKGKKVVRYVSYSSINMKVSPITENPKVREIFYQVKVEVIKSLRGFQDYYNTFEKTGETKMRFLKRILLNFNEAHSRELGRLFNYLEEEQQKRFSKMVETYLSPYLKGTGLRLKSATFSL